MKNNMPQMKTAPEIKMDWVPRRLRRGERVRLKITLEIPEGIHIQAHEPAEELLIPTRITLKEAEGLAMEEPVYPEPDELPVSWSEVTLLTYEGKIDILVPIQVAKDARPGGREVEGKLSFQGCTPGACLPPREQGFALALEIL